MKQTQVTETKSKLLFVSYLLRTEIVLELCVSRDDDHNDQTNEKEINKKRKLRFFLFSDERLTKNKCEKTKKKRSC